MAIAVKPVFATIPEALDELRAGRMVVVVDDEDRENQGDLTMAAERVTPEAINFMAREGRGLTCLALTAERCRDLGLGPMTSEQASPSGTAFMVSIEARHGVSTGISAADRAHTIRVAVAPSASPRDIVKPGHVHPLRARAGGVLRRPGHTEAAVDLARLTGLSPAGVTCEIMADDGTMARGAELEGFAARHGLRIVRIADLVAHRLAHDRLIERVVSTTLPTRFGTFTAVGYRRGADAGHHLALVKGDVAGRPDVLVRFHEASTIGDVFHARLSDSGSHLERALRRIEREGAGALIYLSTSDEGSALLRQLGVAPPRSGRDEAPCGVQILRDLGVSSVRLLVGDSERGPNLQGSGITVQARVALDSGEAARPS